MITCFIVTAQNMSRMYVYIKYISVFFSSLFLSLHNTHISLFGSISKKKLLMDNRTNTHRLRINATLRMGTEKQAMGSREQHIKPSELLEVKIPRSLQQQLAPRVDHSLRPIQTNLKTNDRSRKPLKSIRNTDPLPAPDPVKKSNHIKKSYKLVEDKDIPDTLIDKRHNLSYKKLELLGFVSFKFCYSNLSPIDFFFFLYVRVHLQKYIELKRQPMEKFMLQKLFLKHLSIMKNLKRNYLLKSIYIVY